MPSILRFGPLRIINRAPIACLRVAGLPGRYAVSRLIRAISLAGTSVQAVSLSSSPRKRRAVRGKKCGCKSAADDSFSSSWPGLSWLVPAIYVFLGVCSKTWMPGTRPHKAGHDDCKVYHSSCGLVGRAVRNFPGQPCAQAGKTRKGVCQDRDFVLRGEG